MNDTDSELYLCRECEMCGIDVHGTFREILFHLAVLHQHPEAAKFIAAACEA